MEGLFPDADMVDVVLPAGDDRAVGGLAGLRRLLTLEHGELEVECGAPTRVVTGPSEGARATLALAVDADADGPAARRVSRSVVVVSGRHLDEVTAALSLLRTMRRTGAGALTDGPDDDVGAACDRLTAEVASTYPGFALRRLDWATICDEHRPLVDAADPVPGLQRWVARLADAHTAVHAQPRDHPLPITARVVEGRVVVAEVATGTAAAAAGVTRGWTVEGIDLDDLAARWGASPQSRPWLLGRRALSGPAGVPTIRTYRSPDGRRATVADVPGEVAWHDHLAVERLPTGSGYLRLRHWSPDDADAIDEALRSLSACERLLVDLRGNPGGSLVSAHEFRRRFVATPTTLGSVRYSVGDGSLSARFPIEVEPSDRQRWSGRVRVLIDGLTYSASEDAIQGLSQLPSVEIVGSPTGGGSGRPRSVRLLDDVVLTVSTALTYDHTGHCIEGAGVRPDRVLPLPAGRGGAAVADRGW